MRLSTGLIVELIMLKQIVWRPAIILIISVSFCFISAMPAASQSPEEYFKFSYSPVTFSKNKISGSEVFHAIVSGQATCVKNLPVPVNEVSITYSVTAEHTKSGEEVTLNSSYTVTIDPFPYKEGDTTEINEAMPLQFPAQAEPGDYNVIGKLVDAKAKVLIGGFNVTEYLPQELVMGSLKYVSSEATSTTSPGLTSSPTPSSPPSPPPAPKSTEGGISWWIWLIIAVAVVITVVIIIYFRRQIS